jgi:nucleotide-binding universal stress UspA family protein
LSAVFDFNLHAVRSPCVLDTALKVADRGALEQALIEIKAVPPGRRQAARQSQEPRMIKYIVVPATGTATDAPVFATALAVARLLPAHLEFLHVRVDVQSVLTAMAANDVSGGAGYDQMLGTLERDAEARQRAAETAFRDFCEQGNVPVSSDPATNLPSAELRMETGDEPTWLAAHGRAADLVVVGREREGEETAMDTLEACLMDTGRPVLIAPAKAPASLSGVVAVAWKDAPAAADAVAAAMPFIELADRVVILSVDEGRAADGAACERLRHALAWHNARVEVHSLKPEGRAPVDVLLAAAGSAKSDLLVMGGYSHSRMREVIFGGFTRRVLHRADIAVLMAH